MNRFQLFKTLRSHRKLEEKRALNFQQNKTAKGMLIFLSVFILLYLIFFAILLSLIANNSSSYTSLEIGMGVAPFLLSIDFLLRFTTQQTPSQLVKPYILLPLKKYACVDTFLLTSLTNSNNLIWMALLVPFAIMSVVFSYGIGSTLLFLFLYWLLIIANSQWYIICRTLVNDTLLWWLFPLGMYATIYSPLFLYHKNAFTKFFDFYATNGTLLETHNLLGIGITLCLLGVLCYVNRKIQYAHVRTELTRQKNTTMKTVSTFNVLNRFGETGEYLKLEIKSLMRNKNPRKGFISINVLVIFLVIVISMTTVYDNSFMTNFWGIYCFMMYGATQLIRIMCNEGNYIDLLMVRKENILSLLKAKYWFSTIMLLLPFVLLLPVVFTGKWSLLMLLSYMLFTAGFQYFVLFQMAVYNNQTIPLNEKFIGKAGMENNYIQVVVQLVTFFLPVAVIQILTALWGSTVAYLVLLITGVVFISTKDLWLRNIYKRMMKRKYKNLASFRATR